MAIKSRMPNRRPARAQETSRRAVLQRYRLHGVMGLVVVTAVLLVACAGPSKTTSPAPAPTSPGAQFTPTPRLGAQPERAPGTKMVELPLDFQIRVYRGEDVLGGKNLLFSSIFGKGEPVILNFWAGLCPPCRAEMPDFQSVYPEYRNSVTIFGLDIGPFVGLGNEEDARALLQELKVSYPTGTTSDAKVVSAYQVLGMPTTVFLTPDGKVFKKWTGLLTRAKLVELIEELLRASS